MKKKTVYIILAFVFVILQCILLTNVMAEDGDPLEAGITITLFVIFIWLNTKGLGFVKWLLGIGLFLFGVGCMLAAQEQGSITLMMIGLFNLFYSIYIFMYKTTKETASMEQSQELNETINED